MTVRIIDKNTSHDYECVPASVGKALIKILDECANTDTKIVSSDGEIYDESGNK